MMISLTTTIGPRKAAFSMKDCDHQVHRAARSMFVGAFTAWSTPFGRLPGAALPRRRVGHCADSYREPPLSVIRFRRHQFKRRRVVRREGHHADDFGPQPLGVIATGIEDMMHHDVAIDAG